MSSKAFVVVKNISKKRSISPRNFENKGFNQIRSSFAISPQHRGRTPKFASPMPSTQKWWTADSRDNEAERISLAQQWGILCVYGLAFEISARECVHTVPVCYINPVKSCQSRGKAAESDTKSKMARTLHFAKPYHSIGFAHVLPKIQTLASNLIKTPCSDFEFLHDKMKKPWRGSQGVKHC